MAGPDSLYCSSWVRNLAVPSVRRLGAGGPSQSGFGLIMEWSPPLSRYEGCPSVSRPPHSSPYWSHSEGMELSKVSMSRVLPTGAPAIRRRGPKTRRSGDHRHSAKNNGARPPSPGRTEFYYSSHSSESFHSGTRQHTPFPAFPTSPPLFTAPAPVRTPPPGPSNPLHAAPPCSRCLSSDCLQCLYARSNPRVPGPLIGVTRLGSPASPRIVPVDAAACRAYRDPGGRNRS